MAEYTLHLGDCRDVLARMGENQIDTFITDPPYGLGFMGKGWDYGVPGVEFWTVALRVAKPGAHLLAFGGTRTFHRLAVAIEEAGWEIRDTIMWVYGSGFPKSHNLQGEWRGWGTALKPAWEPIVVAMKPLDGTFVENAERWGVAGLWIDGGRVEAGEDYKDAPPVIRYGETSAPMGGHHVRPWVRKAIENGEPVKQSEPSKLGRWPANLIHDGSEEVLDLFPKSEYPSGIASGPNLGKLGTQGIYGPATGDFEGPAFYGDVGSAARFFYCAKATRAERNAGLEGMEQRAELIGAAGHKINPMTGKPVVDIPRANHHPTVKPLALMRYLCKLTRTPTGGVVCDPFMGSGSTGAAALLERRDFIGIEIEPEYLEISRRRIEHAAKQPYQAGLFGELSSV